MLLLDGRAVKFSMGVFQLNVDYRVLLWGCRRIHHGNSGRPTSCVEMFAPPHNRSSQGLMKERKSHDSDQQDVRKPSHYYRNDGCNYFVSTRFSDVRQNGETATAKDSLLPAGLFLKRRRQTPSGVSEARKTAEEGKPIVMRGRIGGTAKPIAEKYAMFLITDVSIGLCKDGCAGLLPSASRAVMSNMATVQVVDNSGRPLKVPIEGIDGLKPLVEVVVKGIVAKAGTTIFSW